MGWCDSFGAPGPWQELDRLLVRRHVRIGPPCLEQTTGGEHSATGNHPKRRARDYSKAMGSDVETAARALLPLWDAGLLLELYYAPMGIWLPSNVCGHEDHVHVAIRPGIRLVRLWHDDDDR